MKRWIASAAALFLVVALAGPAVAAEQRDSDTGFSWSLDIDQLVGWLTTLWSDDAPATPAATSDEEPRAFIESVGPYIVPVGYTSTDPEATTQTDDDDEPGDS